MRTDPWLPRPAFDIEPDAAAALEHVFDRHRRTSPGAALSRGLPSDPPTPLWTALQHLTASRDLLLHGSGDGGIARFEPRAPDDRSPDAFSKQRAVFATSDAIWAIFYAVLDRSRPLRFLNGALQRGSPGGEWSGMRYFFSVTDTALRAGAWRRGSVYLLPATGFERQPPYELSGTRVLEPHFARPEPVAPLARVDVGPEDFPLLGAVLGHDDARLERCAEADPHGFPWWDCLFARE